MERELERSGNWQGHRYFLKMSSFSVTTILWTTKGAGKYSIEKKGLHLGHVISLWSSFLTCEMGSISVVKTLLFYLLLFSSLLAFPSTHLYFVIFTSFSLFFPEPKTQPAFFYFSPSGEDQTGARGDGQWVVLFPSIWDDKPFSSS